MTPPQQKRSLLLPVVIVVAVVASIGTVAGVDWRESFNAIKERFIGKEVCFTVENKPRQVTAVAWHVGADADHFTREFRRWHDCRPAETGENVGLSAEKTMAGVTTCSIVVMPDNVQLGNGPVTGGPDAAGCHISAIVL